MSEPPVKTPPPRPPWLPVVRREVPAVGVLPPPLPPRSPPPLPSAAARSCRRPPPLTSPGPDVARRVRLTDRSRGTFGSAAVHTFALLVLALVVLPIERPDPGMTTLVTMPGVEDAAIDTAVAIEAPEVESPPAAVVTDLVAAPLPVPDLPASDATGVSDTAHGSPASAVGMPGGTDMAGGDGLVGRLAAAGAKTGAIQVSLFWDNLNDLDLHVVTPSGEVIYYSNRRSAEGGELDVDMNVRAETPTPVENVYFPEGVARPGRYAVVVNHFRNNGSPDPTAFRVRVVVDGRETWIRRQAIRGGQPARVVSRFTYEPGEGALTAR